MPGLREGSRIASILPSRNAASKSSGPDFARTALGTPQLGNADSPNHARRMRLNQAAANGHGRATKARKPQTPSRCRAKGRTATKPVPPRSPPLAKRHDHPSRGLRLNQTLGNRSPNWRRPRRPVDGIARGLPQSGMPTCLQAVPRTSRRHSRFPWPVPLSKAGPAGRGIGPMPPTAPSLGPTSTN